MKKFIFNNGQTRLESQIAKGKDFKTACIMWGCSNAETGEPLPHIVRRASSSDLSKESNRISEIKQEFEEVKHYNKLVHKGNKKLANASNIEEFMNAYK